MARTPLNGGSLQIGMIFVACILMLALAVVIWLYRSKRIAVFNWPDANDQKNQPWNAMIGVEFVSIVAATLCFSPQTNTRHLMLMLLMTIALSALILGVRRWPAALGRDRLVSGIYLSTRWSGGAIQTSEHLVVRHRRPMLVPAVLPMFTLISAGLTQAKAAATKG